MFDKLAGIESRYNELERLLADNEILNDYSRVSELAQERSNLEPIVQKFYSFRKCSQDLEGAQALLQSENDPELYAMAEEEVNALQTQLAELDSELTVMLLPKDPRDDKNVIIEVRAGTGGDEAGLFAADLFRMYTRYAEDRRWKIELESTNLNSAGGYKEVVFSIKGKGAYSRFKYESGVHRVQRVPATETQGRIHTSTATVAVLAEAQEVDVQIDPKDIDVEFRRSQGAGGQHVQKNETAVRITHKATGLVIDVQDERSQLQNRLRAMVILRARLFELEQQRIHSEEDAERKGQIGTGARSEKIRTYNYPQNRVTDHRIGMDIYNLPAVMDGDLDRFVDELATRDRAEQLGGSGLVSVGVDDDE